MMINWSTETCWIPGILIILIITYFLLFKDIAQLSDISPIFVVLSALIMFSLGNYLYEKSKTN